MQVSKDTESVIDTDTAGRGIDYRVLGIAHHYIFLTVNLFKPKQIYIRGSIDTTKYIAVNIFVEPRLNAQFAISKKPQ